MKPLLLLAVFALPQIAGYYVFTTRGAISAPASAYEGATLYFATPERAVETVARLAAARDWGRLAAYCEAGCASVSGASLLAATEGASYLSHEAARDDIVFVTIRTASGKARLYLRQHPQGLRLTAPPQER